MEHYHFIGIGGIGMSGLARILLQRKVKVSGSDISNNKIIESLLDLGAIIHLGHSEKHITSGMTVVYSTDIKKNNPEYLAAVALECTFLHRSELLQRRRQCHRQRSISTEHLAWRTTRSAVAPMK